VIKRGRNKGTGIKEKQRGSRFDGRWGWLKTMANV
jgi:hypothetical protein